MKYLLFYGITLLATLAVVRSDNEVEYDCADILGNNQMTFTLEQINLCAGVEEVEEVDGRLIMGDAPADAPADAPGAGSNKMKKCPAGMKCLETDEVCPMGHKRDQYNCPICPCVVRKPGDIMFGDVELTDFLIYAISDSVEDIERPDKKYGKAAARGAAASITLWQNIRSGNNYVVPYEIDPELVGDTNFDTGLRDGIQDFDKNSCVRLVPRSNNEKYYIRFIDGSGCSSPVGRNEPPYNVNSIKLASGCRRKGTIMHEILHSLGFWHEQMRPDRDQHVVVHTENIIENYERNFNKFSEYQINSRGSPYDYSSVMHYSSSAFSKNGSPTITDLDGNTISGQRYGLSTTDWEQLNVLYPCSVTVTITCEDELPDDCPQWTEAGYCTETRYQSYMSENCRKSCQLCEGTATTGQSTTTSTTTQSTTTRQSTTSSTTEPTTTTSTSTSGGNCNDLQAGCATWAGKNYCNERYVDYMATNCQKSCGLCGTATSSTTQSTTTTSTTSTSTNGGNCNDLHASCATWAGKNYCNVRYVQYMATNCQKSCGLCGTATSSTTQSTTRTSTNAGSNDCQDLNQNSCPGWAGDGYCSGQYENYMYTNCKKSCNVCGCINRKSFDMCQRWEQLGYCTSDYVKGMCEKTCGICSRQDSDGMSSCVNKDSDQLCNGWAQEGYCDSVQHESYMEQYCAKSCEVC